MSKLAKNKRLWMLEVVWVDSQLFVGGWAPHADVMSRRKRTVQRSVGYVLADDKKGVVLTESLSEGGNVYGTVAIPAAQIVSRRRVL